MAYPYDERDDRFGDGPREQRDTSGRERYDQRPRGEDYGDDYLARRAFGTDRNGYSRRDQRGGTQGYDQDRYGQGRYGSGRDAESRWSSDDRRHGEERRYSGGGGYGDTSRYGGSEGDYGYGGGRRSGGGYGSGDEWGGGYRRGDASRRGDAVRGDAMRRGGGSGYGGFDEDRRYGDADRYRDLSGWGDDRLGYGAMAGYPGPERTFAGPYGYGVGEDRDRREGGYSGDRGFFERARDEVASWFGSDDAERRRRQDAREGDSGAQHHRGRGPRNYTRSDERIRDDINDRLTDDPHLDASDIDVTVSNREVTLSGHVDSRYSKRRAEDLAESVSGVSHVQNNLRVRERGAFGEGGRTGTGSGTSGGTGGAGGAGSGGGRQDTSTGGSDAAHMEGASVGSEAARNLSGGMGTSSTTGLDRTADYRAGQKTT